MRARRRTKATDPVPVLTGPGSRILSAHGPSPWHKWLGRLAVFDRPTVADTVDHTLVDYARCVGFPEATDYELRREMALASRRHGGRVPSPDAFDRLCESLASLLIGTEVMHLAAEYWAEVRHRGQPTARPPPARLMGMPSSERAPCSKSRAASPDTNTEITRHCGVHNVAHSSRSCSESRLVAYKVGGRPIAPKPSHLRPAEPGQRLAPGRRRCGRTAQRHPPHTRRSHESDAVAAPATRPGA